MKQRTDDEIHTCLTDNLFRAASESGIAADKNHFVSNFHKTSKYEIISIENGLAVLFSNANFLVLMNMVLFLISYGKPVFGNYFLSMKLKRTPESKPVEFYTKPGSYQRTVGFGDRPSCRFQLTIPHVCSKVVCFHGCNANTMIVCSRS